MRSVLSLINLKTYCSRDGYSSYDYSLITGSENSN